MMIDCCQFDRRRFLATTVSCLLWPTSISLGDNVGKKPIAKAAPFVKPKSEWGANHLYEFLNALPDEAMLLLMKSLDMVDAKADLGVLKGKSQDVREVQKQLLWLSSNILAYPFRNEAAVNYHKLVVWVAKSGGVKSEIVEREPTFTLEREFCKTIFKTIFVEVWDKLNPEQRMELLQKIDSEGHIKDKTAIAALGGAAALGSLSVTVAFSGFAFYTTMSVTISTVAGFFGLTLPFAAYAGASSLVAFLTGPVGWAIMGLAALGGTTLAGRANVTKTAASICQIHALKVDALKASGVSEKEIFG